MERGFYQEDIEDLIKQKADQYKMYPSEKVWKGVHRALHTRRKWYLLSFVLFLSGIGYYTAELLSPSQNKPVADNPQTITAKAEADTKPQATILPFGNAAKPGNNTTSSSTKNTFIINPEVRDIAPAIVSKSNEALPASDLVIAGPAPVYDLQTGRLKEIPNNIFPDITLNPVNDESLPLALNTPAIEAIESQVQGRNNSILNPAPHSAEKNEDAPKVNWLQEYAVYELTPAKPKRLSWQLAFSPTMNYRKLTGSRYANISSDVKNVPFALNIEGDPDKLLNHKPALGFELGSHFLYALNKDLSLKAGLQFNYSRYDIQAYKSEPERNTITLNSVGGPSNNLTTYSNLSNFGGDEVEDLRNQYFQLSLPVGLELRVVGNNKLQLNIAGTIQPTYLLNRNTYLVTTDYKNYTKEPSLVRRWNMNTAAEAFISYKTGELKWQVGPQFRYQLFSSYTSKYPIREHLMEYGIKIGVTKTIR